MFIVFVILACITAVAILCAWHALDQRDEARVDCDVWRAHNRQLGTELHREKQARCGVERLLAASCKSNKYLRSDNARLIAEVARLTRARDAHGRYLKKS